MASQGYAPRIGILHTSGAAIGQTYLPGIDFALLIAVTVLVLVFRSRRILAAAYGIAVSGRMIITTVFAYLVARYDWTSPGRLAIAAFLLFVLIDSAFFIVIIGNAILIPCIRYPAGTFKALFIRNA